MHYYFLKQALLSGTILQAFPEKIKILTNSFNYPLNVHSQLFEGGSVEFNNIRILHYHKHFKDKWLNEVSMLPSEVIKWLTAYFPLKKI